MDTELELKLELHVAKGEADETCTDEGECMEVEV